MSQCVCRRRGEVSVQAALSTLDFLLHLEQEFSRGCGCHSVVKPIRADSFMIDECVCVFFKLFLYSLIAKKRKNVISMMLIILPTPYVHNWIFHCHTYNT